MRRFFVRIFAPDEDALTGLAGRGLDLMHATALRANAERRDRSPRARQTGPSGQGWAEPLHDSAEALAGVPWVDALITLEQLESLVGDGYRVLVNADSAARARAGTQTIEFDAWLKGMEER